MTPEEAIDKLNEGKCPLDDTPVMPRFDSYDEDGAHYFSQCESSPPHTWPIRRTIVERDTNYFEAQYEPDDIADKLDEYAA